MAAAFWQYCHCHPLHVSRYVSATVEYCWAINGQHSQLKCLRLFHCDFCPRCLDVKVVMWYLCFECLFCVLLFSHVSQWLVVYRPISAEYWVTLMMRGWWMQSVMWWLLYLDAGGFRDGASRSGLVCTLSAVLERLKLEHEVDIFQSVRHARINRPQVVPVFVSAVTVPYCLITSPCWFVQLTCFLDWPGWNWLSWRLPISVHCIWKHPFL